MAEPDLLDMLAEHDANTEATILGSDAARAVGRFNADGPDGYRAATAPDAPPRATRKAAEADELRHRAGCDYRVGYLDGLRRAAAYVQDYGHHLDRAEIVRLQAPMLRTLAIAECDECNAVGCITDAQGRHIEHHPADRRDRPTEGEAG